MSDNLQHEKFMRRAIELSAKTSLVDNAGGVFGTVIVRDGEIIAEGANRVVAERDPTWHGEMEAIRKACQKLGSFKLNGCTMYTSAEPCPMCAAASYWAGIEQIYYGATVGDALEYGGFDDAMIFEQLRRPTQTRTIPASQIQRAEAVEIWKEYQAKPDKIAY
jgi:tRNA(Arg) A34 adenosine deaminase TadA